MWSGVSLVSQSIVRGNVLVHGKNVWCMRMCVYFTVCVWNCRCIFSFTNCLYIVCVYYICSHLPISNIIHIIVFDLSLPSFRKKSVGKWMLLWKVNRLCMVNYILLFFWYVKYIILRVDEKNPMSEEGRGVCWRGFATGQPTKRNVNKQRLLRPVCLYWHNRIAV